MRGEIIHQLYVADGFPEDCDALIQRCLQAEKLTYEFFCEIWKDMKFDSLYVGRTSVVEIAELSEELIHTAKHFMLANVKNFEENVAGLFIVYGLVNLQPYPGFAWVRLVPDDVHAIKRLEMRARRERRHDVLYILGAVLVQHSRHHAEERERGMEQVYRKYLDGYVGIDHSGFRPRGVFYRHTEELDLVREAAAVCDRYEAAKMAITGGKENQSLSFINKNLLRELDSSLKKLVGGLSNVDDDDEIGAADVHYCKVQAIKERAMKTAVGGMKHLTTAANRSPPRIESRIVTEIKSKPGKVKTSSPVKTVMSPKKRGKAKPSTSKSPKSKSPKSKSSTSEAASPSSVRSKKAVKSPKSNTAKASTSKQPVKRKRGSPKRKSKRSKAYISESSSDTDISLEGLVNDTDEDDKSNSDDEIVPNKESVETDKLESDTGADGTMFEIEIIDKFDKSKVPESYEDPDDEEPSCSNENLKLPKPKRPTIFLSRMGILPVSNFPEEEPKLVMSRDLTSTVRNLDVDDLSS